jgi:hypothetical protein
MTSKLRIAWLASIPLGIGIISGVAATPISVSNDTKRKTPRTIDYNKDIRPILSEHCWKCHGPDEAINAKTGGVRLDSFAGATKVVDGMAPISPGKASESLVYQRITEKVAAMRMPPADSGVAQLTPEQIETLKLWIDQGAEYRAHWAFVPPMVSAFPEVKNEKWVRNPVDRYILSGLEQSKLAPEPEANSRALIRRVALTLTGLPPTVLEVQKFLKDSSPGAYERMVDRYLASPYYGQNQARYWLDAVRYGDTHGLHIDNERAIYPYRDWVVRAANEDLPFDKFTLWQFGGDLMPSPTLDMKIATAYIRMNVTTNEGGAIEEEVLAKNTFDRVDTTSTVYLGLTAGCAKCHDHKFDPISQKDYYGLYAFFNSTKDAPLDGNIAAPEPAIKAPTPVQRKLVLDYQKQLTLLASQVKVDEAKAWIASNRIAQPAISKWEVSQAFPGKNFDELYDTAYSPEKPDATEVMWKPLALELDKNILVVLREVACAYVKGKITLDANAKVTFRLGSDDAIKMWVDGKLAHANKVLRGVTEATDTVDVDLAAGIHDVLIKVINNGGPDGLRVGIGDQRSLRIDDTYRKIQAGGGEGALREIYLELGPESKAGKEFRDIKKRQVELEAQIPLCLVAEELPKPRQTYVLRRGEYNLPTTPVGRSIPAAFGALPEGAPRDRLGFARWLVSSKNPLVSRVYVNRIWQQHFGTGLVKTAEDFGNQGDWPSHPELLDYLAVKFVKDGWSLKKLHRLLLTSATFRQAATSSVAKRSKDPENRLVSRGPRFRLDAEVLRDQTLYVSGLLNPVESGKGFKPYQPMGIWEALGFLESNTSRYVQDKGSDIYRRSLYLFWKRTSPPPTMLSFDAPMRESCSVRRSRTNTPLQALVTMNEPMFVESARVFAERLLKFKADDNTRLAKLFEICMSRPGSAAEIKLLENSLAYYEKDFRKPGASFEILTTGDTKADPTLSKPKLAAYTMIVSTLFNTDEFLTQH